MTTTWRWSRLLTDGLEVLGVVWALPVAILVIGAPVALALALVVWLGRMGLRAF